MHTPSVYLSYLWVMSASALKSAQEAKPKCHNKVIAIKLLYRQAAKAEQEDLAANTSSKQRKWVPVDENLTQEEFNIKKQIFDGAKATEKKISQTTEAEYFRK